jgi:hypothetical protein
LIHGGVLQFTGKARYGMADRVIEGKWEDVVLRDDLRGHRVRVIVMDETTTTPTTDAEWLRRLRAWAAGRPKVAHVVDDSRDAIYGGAVDDPR